MSDYGYVAERARSAFSAVARSAQALARNPQSSAAQLNYASRKKLADQSQEELLRLAEINNIEVCNYRLISFDDFQFPLADVSRSCLNYQLLFSQVHDSVRNGPKNNALIGDEAYAESTLQIAYTYAGSLGIVMLAQSQRSFFEGSLDPSINALFDVVNVKSRSDVQRVVERLGNSVIKRVRDWSAINSQGGFSIDLRWKRSDGANLGGVFEKKDFDLIVDMIGEISDESRDHIRVVGTLVGIDLKSGTFHISSELVPDIRGTLQEEFPRDDSVEVGVNYDCDIIVIEKVRYATGVSEVRFELKRLTAIST